MLLAYVSLGPQLLHSLPLHPGFLRYPPVNPFQFLRYFPIQFLRYLPFEFPQHLQNLHFLMVLWNPLPREKCSRTLRVLIRVGPNFKRRTRRSHYVSSKASSLPSPYAQSLLHRVALSTITLRPLSVNRPTLINGLVTFANCHSMRTLLPPASFGPCSAECFRLLTRTWCQILNSFAP